MKTYKNKKFYNFTPKQKRKDRFRQKRHYWSAPSWYRKMFNDSAKAKRRETLRKILKGYEVEFEMERKNVLWYYL